MTILFIILILLAIPFIRASFLTDEYSIEKQTMINKAKQPVFNYVRLLRNAEHYNKWMMMDPNMKKEFKGTDGTQGFVYSWDSTNKNVGAGEQEITGITEGERVNYEIRFIRPFRGVSYAWITTEMVTASQTRVDWVFKGVRNYPMKVMHSVLNLKKVLGNDLQTSLDNLKAVLEQQP